MLSAVAWSLVILVVLRIEPVVVRSIAGVSLHISHTLHYSLPFPIRTAYASQAWNHGTFRSRALQSDAKDDSNALCQ